MFLFIPRSLCALKRVAAKAEHARLGTTGAGAILVKTDHGSQTEGQGGH